MSIEKDRKYSDVEGKILDHITSAVRLCIMKHRKEYLAENGHLDILVDDILDAWLVDEDGEIAITRLALLTL